MGIAYQMMFNLADAARCYQASLRLDPKNARVFNNLGTVYDSLNNTGMPNACIARRSSWSPTPRSS